jgi:hypothetical protein
MKTKQIKVTLQHLFHGGFRVEQITNAISVDTQRMSGPAGTVPVTVKFEIGSIIENPDDAKALCADTRYEVTVKALK